MSLFCAYLVSGTPVNELESFTDSDVGGNLPYVIDTTVPSGYQDISTIENWCYFYEFYGIIIKDYKYVRNEIMILAATIGWTNLTSTEKTIAANMFAVGSTERDELYTIEQQIELGITHHLNSMEARQTRLTYVQMELFNRLPKLDWEEVAGETLSLTTRYVNEGLEGTVEGDLPGLLDYVDGESRTGTIWSTGGSEIGFREKTYTVTGYASCSLLADHLLDILKNGEY